MPENNFFANIESNAYFQSLPTFIQETIKQGNSQITSEADLRKCAENLMQGSKKQAQSK